MKINIDGKEIEIKGYKFLDQETDDAFKILLTEFLNDPERDYRNLILNLYPAFEQKIHEYYDKVARANSRQQDFTSNLTIIWNQYLSLGRYGEAQSLWERVLRTIRDWERTSGIRVHKGSPLYFWSASALMQGETDKGFFLMHQAYEEDIQTTGMEFPDTPAYKFVTLNFKDDKQLLFEYVKVISEYLNTFFVKYRLERKSQITLEDFSQKYLQNPPSIYSIFSFTHSLSKLWKLSLLPQYTTRSKFAGQYGLNLLFDLILVIDEAIDHKDQNNHWRFIEFADYLARESGLDVSRNAIVFAKDQIDNSFDITLSQLLDSVFIFNDGTMKSKFCCDLCIVYSLRNHSAHNLASFPSIWLRYKDICQSLFNILLLVVDELY